MKHIFSIEIKGTILTRIKPHPFLNIIAAAGKRTAVLLSKIENKLICTQRHIDENTNEKYTCCEFTKIKSSEHLVLGGSSGIIKFLDLQKVKFSGYVKGHGGIINDLKTHPIKRNILFSASEDMSIRMWDCTEKKCLVIFGGYSGHCDHVLSIDISLCGNFLVSSGTDCTIKVWKIPSLENRDVNTVECVYFPIFSSSKIHKSYINCVKFYGELIISKSLSNRIVIIKPHCTEDLYTNKFSSDATFIKEYKIESFKLIPKFDVINSNMVLGSFGPEGLIHLIDLNDSTQTVSLKTEKEIREMAITDDGLFVLYKGSIISWNSTFF